ncbi:helix-turn-helix domain-containing protein [Oerskovia sp. NPDC060338]|uniref:helix-turn-helix domain-containing protein n=1 Tax=Oerskovia sp. NPDC060338 TaxID=3347100 RepID=UPI003663C428
MERTEEEKWIAAIAATLRAERGVAGLSQAEVSRRTGIARTSYRFYEEGERQPDVLQLAAISEAFGMSLSQLIAEVVRRV